MKLPVEAEKLIPHRGRMLLIDTVLSAKDGNGTVIATPAGDSIARGPDGKIMAPFFIELVAQSYAAVCGFDFISRGLPVPEGYLVGAQKFEIHQDTACCNKEMLISVQTVGEFKGFAVVQGTVSRDRHILAEGTIKLYVPQETLPKVSTATDRVQEGVFS